MLPLVATERPVDWMPPSIFRPPELLTELEAVEAEKELMVLQPHVFEIVNPEIEWPAGQNLNRVSLMDGAAKCCMALLT
jgi:hypothetical protein